MNVTKKVRHPGGMSRPDASGSRPRPALKRPGYPTPLRFGDTSSTPAEAQYLSNRGSSRKECSRQTKKIGLGWRRAGRQQGHTVAKGLLGLGHVHVLGLFAQVLGHAALDHARGGPESARRQRIQHQVAPQALGEGDMLGGCDPLKLRHGLADDLNRLHELAVKGQNGDLTAEEAEALRNFRQVGLQIDLLRSKARLAIKQSANQP